MAKPKPPRPLPAEQGALTLNDARHAQLTVDAAPPSCATCAHWRPLDDPRLPRPGGQCRRYPPVTPGPILGVSGPVCMFPITLSDDLCGEHAPRR